MPLRHLSPSLSRALHTPDWRRQMRWRRSLWHTFSRLGLTGLHAAPVHRSWLDVQRLDMPLRGLGPALHNLRVVQISDLHVSPVVSGAFLRFQLDHVAALKPDLLVVTGDLITGGYRYMPLAADLLAGLDPFPPVGVVCTLGNHDYAALARRQRREADRRADAIARVFEKRGLTLLRNQVYAVTRGGHSLKLVGLDDLWTGRLDADAAFAGLDESEPIVCLNHDPRNTPELLPYPWQWKLSGHTHGRQLGTSVVGRRFNHKRRRTYVRGLYELPGGKKLYVNRGLSYGQRWERACRPEITVFRLRSAPA